mmetsp:Transcript_48022/g.104555  ORF Transcript_48022/g.104555 Transcript_48022/m.104555 type:complete len:203 (+) Transcript_48022:946-1554(+)
MSASTAVKWLSTRLDSLHTLEKPAKPMQCWCSLAQKASKICSTGGVTPLSMLAREVGVVGVGARVEGVAGAWMAWLSQSGSAGEREASSWPALSFSWPSSCSSRAFGLGLRPANSSLAACTSEPEGGATSQLMPAKLESKSHRISLRNPAKSSCPLLSAELVILFSSSSRCWEVRDTPRERRRCLTSSRVRPLAVSRAPSSA